MSADEDAFEVILRFALLNEKLNFVKFHKNTSESSDWKCYFGQYGSNGHIVWTKSGKGITIYDAAFEALNSDKRFHV